MERHCQSHQDLSVGLYNFVLFHTGTNKTHLIPEVMFTYAIHVSRPEVNATSLSFFLVMPVQRIARYPLLLQTIQKHTEKTHPAYGLLEQTAHTSIALNCRINEYKRFREVGELII